MLTLTDSLLINDHTVYRDVIVENEQRKYTNLFYVVPSEPRFVKEADGLLAFNVLLFRSLTDHTVAGGGLLSFTTDLLLNENEKQMLREGIIEAQVADSLNQIELRNINFKRGEVQLSFAGDESGDFVNKVAGTGKATLVSGQRTSFSVDLNAEGVSLLLNAIENDRQILHARFDMQFTRRLDDIRLRVWCDVKSSHRLLANALTQGKLATTDARALLVERQLAGVSVTAGHQINAEELTELENVGHEVLERAMASTLFNQGNEAGAGNLRAYEPGMDMQLNFLFKQSYPINSHIVIDGFLDLSAIREDRDTYVSMINIDQNSTLHEVQIVCTADFNQSIIALVIVHLKYDETDNGQQLTRSKDISFNEAGQISVFRFDMLSADRRSVACDVEVFYQGHSDPYHISYPKQNTNLIVIDGDQLGALDLLISVRNVDFERVESIILELKATELDQQQKFILDRTTLEQTWHVAFYDTPVRYRYRISWILNNSSRQQEAWQESDSRQLYIDAPRLLDNKKEVQIITAGDYTGVTSLVVELKNHDGGFFTFNFLTEQDAKSCKLTLNDQRALAYEYRETFMYHDGTRKVMEWKQGHSPVLVVTNPAMFTVTLLPALLKIGEVNKLVIVELAFNRENQVTREQKVITIRNNDEKPAWSIKSASHDNHRFEYRVTRVSMAGERTTGDWMMDSREVIVLQA